MSEIKIQGYRILLKPQEVLEKFESELDLVKPEDTKKTEMRNLRICEVLGVGRDAYRDAEQPWCKTGDTVLINPQAGFSHEHEGVLYLVVNEEDILTTIV